MRETNANVDEQTDGRMNERMVERLELKTDRYMDRRTNSDRSFYRICMNASVMMEFERPYI